jgi:hypothetical protein
MAGVHGNRSQVEAGKGLDDNDLFGIFLILGTLGTVFCLWCLFDSGGLGQGAQRDASPPPLVWEIEGGKS